MNRLITRTLRDKDPTYLAQFPRELLYGEELETVEYIYTYLGEYGTLPSVKNVAEKFGSFLPYYFEASLWEEEDETLSAVYSLAVKARLNQITEIKMREVTAAIHSTGDVPLDVFSDLLRLHTLAEGVISYSTFDRSGYFRERLLDLPFKVLNRATNGMAAGDVLLIVARLGTGKSTIAQYLAYDSLLKGKKILFVSAEMLPYDVFGRIDAMEGHFNPLVLRGKADSDILEKLNIVSAKAKEGKGEILIPRKRLITPMEVSAFARNLQVDAIIIDGIYLLQPNEGLGGSKWERVASVSNSVKQMAMDLELPIIGTAQIKRGEVKGESYDTEAIAYSDALGQDASFVVTIQPHAVIAGRLELELIKNRYGDLVSTGVFIDWDNMSIREESIHGVSEKAVPVFMELDTDKFLSGEWVD